jgi:hypothetical protein
MGWWRGWNGTDKGWCAKVENHLSHQKLADYVSRCEWTCTLPPLPRALSHTPFTLASLFQTVAHLFLMWGSPRLWVSLTQAGFGVRGGRDGGHRQSCYRFKKNFFEMPVRRAWDVQNWHTLHFTSFRPHLQGAAWPRCCPSSQPHATRLCCVAMVARRYGPFPTSPLHPATHSHPRPKAAWQSVFNSNICALQCKTGGWCVVPAASLSLQGHCHPSPTDLNSASISLSSTQRRP